MARQLRVEIVGDSRSLQRALGSATSGADKFGGTIARLGKVAALSAGAAGVGAVVIGLRQGIKEYTESAKVAAQTNAVIKSTGGVANVTAKQVDGLAESMMRKSGVDDEAIKSSENMMLTFLKVRNEVGKGNDVFNQATKAVLDMDTVMTQGNVTSESLAKTSIRVGKALNDPIQGLTALKKVGVSFTEAQKEQIKAMVESGDVMGAQKMILAELTKEFGGSAEAVGKTLPKQLNVLKESFNNFAGDLVAKAIPSVQRFVDFLNTRLIPAEGFTAKLKVVWTGVNEVAQDLIAKLRGQIHVLFTGQDVFSVQEKAMIHIDPQIQIDWAAVRETIKEGFSSALSSDSLSSSLGDQMMAGLGVITGRLGEWAKAQPGVIARDFRSALNAADITADLQKWIVQPVIQAGLSVTAPARQIGANLLAGVRGGAEALGPLMSQTMSSMVNTITQRIPAAFSAAVSMGDRIVSGIGSGLADLGSTVLKKLEGVIRSIATTATNAYAMAVGIGSAIVGGIVAGLGGLIGRVAGAIESGVRGAISRAGGILRGSGDYMFTKHTVGQPMAEGIIEGLAETLAGRLPKNLSSTLLTAMGAAGIDKSATNGGTDIATSLKGGIDTFLEDKLPGNLAAIIGVASAEAMAGLNLTEAGLGVSWTPKMALPVTHASLGPSVLSDPDAGGGPFIINTTVVLDGQKVGQSVTRFQNEEIRRSGGTLPAGALLPAS